MRWTYWWGGYWVGLTQMAKNSAARFPVRADARFIMPPSRGPGEIPCFVGEALRGVGVGVDDDGGGRGRRRDRAGWASWR